MYLFGLPGLAFLALAVLFGYSLLKALKLPLKGLEIVVASPLAGIMAAGWLCLLPFLLTGSLDLGIVVAAVVMPLTALWLRPGLPDVEKEHLPAVTAIALAAFAFMFLGLFNYFDGAYHAAYPFYGDAAFHADIINSFSQGLNFPPEYPMMAGQTMRYTYLMDLYSAALDRLGLGLQWSVVLPGWLLLTGLLSLLYFLGTRFLGRRLGGITAVVLLALSGGAGFMQAFADWRNTGMDLLQFIARENLNYTTDWAHNLVFTNFLIIVMAQRTALLGFTAGLFVMLILYVMLVQRESARGGLLIAGVITGLLPMFHVYSYVCILCTSGVLLLIFRERRWYYFLAPAILLAIPQGLWLYGQMGTSFFRVELGWLAGSAANIPHFWIMNLGLELPLLLIGFFVIARKNLKFYLPFLCIFLVANVFVFQPWDYDNHKFFSFWLMPSVLLMSAALLFFYDIPKLGKPLFAGLLALAVATGALVAIFIVGHPYVELGSADIYVGGWIMENTPKDAVFMTSDWPIHPVTTVAGRKSYLGYGGWMFTHGIDTKDRYAAEKRMFGAYREGEAMQMLNDSGIDYVFIGPLELSSSQFYVNQSFYEVHKELVFNWTDPRTNDHYRIYKV